MGEFAAKFRPEVDLDEFERRLRAAAPAPQPRPEEASDPLAELARLVNGEALAGREDPFEALFRAQTAIAEGRAAAQSRPAATPPQPAPYGLREPYFEQPPSDEHVGAPAAGAGYAHPGEAYPYSGEPYAADPLPYQESEPAWAEASGQGAEHQQAWPAAFSQAAPEPAPRIRREVMYGMALVLALGVAGIAGVLALRGRSSSHEVVTIQADREPARVKPAEVENSAPEGQALFDHKVANGVSKVVASAEQPDDLNAAVKKAPAAGAAAGVATPAPPAPSADGAQTDSLFPPAKKVKTIAVRADGSVINSPEAPVPMTNTLPTMAAGAPTPNAAPAPKPAPAAKTTRRATALAEAAAQASPNSKPREAGSAREAAGEGGGYAVQLAGAPNEADARVAAKRLAVKYSSALHGHHATYAQAKIGAKTVWRVRVGHLDRDKAKSICEAIKGQGGSCFVARN